MRSKSKMVLAVLALTIAVSATSASAASAFTEFSGKEGVGTKVTAAASSGTQLTFNPAASATLNVSCHGATGSGVVTSTKVMTLTGTFGECAVAGLKFLSRSTCHWAYGIAGTFSVEGSACAEFEITTTKCLITVTGNQSGLSNVTYQNLVGSFKSEAELAVGKLAFSTKTGKHCFMTNENETGTFSVSGHMELTGVTER